MKKESLSPKAKELPPPIMVSITDKKAIYEILDRSIVIKENGNPKNIWMFWEWLFATYPELLKIPDGKCRINWYPPMRIEIRQAF